MSIITNSAQSLTTVMQPGLDHSLFPFRGLRERCTFTLPQNGRIAVCLIVVLQHYPIDGQVPFAIPGALDRPFPDLGNFSQRQVGTTDGLWRMVDAIERAGLAASFVIEHEAINRVADIHNTLRAKTHAVIASGLNATTLHQASMPADDEFRIIRESIDAIETVLGRRPLGWRSPACSQSPATLDFLARADIRYTGDFANDDRPYWVRAGDASLAALPMNHFFSDLYLIQQFKQTEWEFYDGLHRGLAQLSAEGTCNAPMVLPVVLHPWITGTPHRIAAFENFLTTAAATAGTEFVNTDTLYHSFQSASPAESAA